MGVGAAVCELDGCGVIAVGRCGQCKLAFCGSHQHTWMVEHQLSTPTQMRAPATCAACSAADTQAKVASERATTVATEESELERDREALEKARLVVESVSDPIERMARIVSLLCTDYPSPSVRALTNWYGPAVRGFREPDSESVAMSMVRDSIVDAIAPLSDQQPPLNPNYGQRFNFGEDLAHVEQTLMATRWDGRVFYELTRPLALWFAEKQRKNGFRATDAVCVGLHEPRSWSRRRALWRDSRVEVVKGPVGRWVATLNANAWPISSLSFLGEKESLGYCGDGASQRDIDLAVLEDGLLIWKEAGHSQGVDGAVEKFTLTGFREEPRFKARAFEFLTNEP